MADPPSDALGRAFKALGQDYQALTARYDRLVDRYNAVIRSRSWWMTRPIRSVLHRLRGQKAAEAEMERYLASVERPPAADNWTWRRLNELGALIPRTGDGVEAIGGHGRATILVAAHELSRSGAPLVLLALLERFVLSVDAELILFTDRGGALVPEFARLAHILIAERYLPFSPGARIADVPGILAKLGPPKPLVAYCNTANTGHYAACFKEAGIPSLCLIHEAATPYTVAQFEQLVASTDRLVFSSGYARETARAKIGDAVDRALIVSQGLLKPRLLTADRSTARHAIRQYLELPADALIVLGCGTMELRKGVDLFLQVAIKTLRKTLENAYFVWLGGGDPDRTHPAWWVKHDAEKSGLGDRIRFCGPQDDTDPWNLAADIFLLPSREDPMPCVVHEAMAAGLPVVAFAGTGGAEEAIGESGVTAQFPDLDAMATEIGFLLADSAKRQALGRQARIRVQAAYDFDDYFKRIREAGQELGGVFPSTPDATLERALR